jgi:hypothetical protein
VELASSRGTLQRNREKDVSEGKLGVYKELESCLIFPFLHQGVSPCTSRFFTG